MSINLLSDAPEGLAPIQGGERIQALDVVRGFALIGIFLMNIEFFNRPLHELGQGLPSAATGANWWAGWFIYTFVQGKFWTMFSFLFGMGFAVMLSRAERAGRNFIKPYLRRIAALAVFGAMHHILIWGGDILFSYSIGAAGLLLLLWGEWKYLLGALVAAIALAALPGMQDLGGVAFGLFIICLAAGFLRWDSKSRFMGREIPTFSLILGGIGAAAVLAAAALWIIPAAPKEPRWPVTVIGSLVLLLGYLSARYREPLEPRTRRLGVAMYLTPFLIMTLAGVTQRYAPQDEVPTGSSAATTQAVTASPDSKGAAPVAAKPAKPGAKPGAKPEKTAAEKLAERKAERAKQMKKDAARIAEERRIETQGSYWEAVRMRAADFAESAPGEPGFAVIIIGMFLLGSWFVRSGVMENTGDHLALFRKLALYGLPVGIGMGLLGQSLATSGTPGMEHDPYQIAMGLTMIGNLPACLGYVSVIVLLLHSGTVFARINVLAPLGRMALTNYLTHSLLGTFYFYGYGLGHFGMGRAMQVLFVAVVITLQVIFCHWWLARFRYGPMEWLWRAITYWTLPPMRR